MLTKHSTVLPAKSDSGVMFLFTKPSSIDYLCIDPIHMIGLIHK